MKQITKEKKMKTNHKLIHCDSRNLSKHIDEKVDLIITSPPYFNLKDYEVDNQIGYGEKFFNYIDSLNKVWNECHELLKNGCRICINIGDVYQSAKLHGKYELKPAPSFITTYFTKELSYEYFGSIIWQKFSSCSPSGGASIMGSYPYPRNGIIKYDYEYILIFRKPGKQPKVNKEIKEKSKMTKEEWKKFFDGHWNIPGRKQKDHGAQFPIELPNRLIKMYSFMGDLVLDPFCGLGTTNESAINLERNSIGADLNIKFLESAFERLNKNNKVELIKRK